MVIGDSYLFFPHTLYLYHVALAYQDDCTNLKNEI